MNYHSPFPISRLRRLRKNASIRELIKETQINVQKLVLPLFVRHGQRVKKSIDSMPGHFQLSLDNLADEIKVIEELEINSVILFGIPEKKDHLGSEAYKDDGLIQSAIAIIKETAPHMLVISDLCFCEYMDHGHCGILHKSHSREAYDVDNDKTLSLLARQAISHAKAGADVIAPSASMDGMVGAIRRALDEASFSSLPILSYSAKYASSLYGPFRMATEGSILFGDRQTYQMDIANAKEAIRECALDISEGTDMLMVKPAHTFLDVIYQIKQIYPELPLAAYHTSGEYAMIKAAAEKGWLDEQKSVIEVLTSICRAGADFVITYYAKELAGWLRKK